MKRYAYGRSLGRVGCAMWLAAAIATQAVAQIAVTPTCQLEAGPVRAVSHVLDGETIRLDDGSEVRLIGALAPRGSDVGAADTDWPLADAARQTLAHLVQGRSVALAFGGRRSDRYGRWLAHLLVERDGNEQWVQGELLELGMARAYTLPDNVACIDDLIARERLGRESGRGLWLNAAYQIRRADQPQELLRYAYTFQLVAGRIVSARLRHDQLYVSFGERGQAALAVAMPAKDTQARQSAHDLKDRTGIVRGWLERRAGAPSIQINAAGELELSEKPARSGDRPTARRTQE